MLTSLINNYLEPRISIFIRHLYVMKYRRFIIYSLTMLLILSTLFSISKPLDSNLNLTNYGMLKGHRHQKFFKMYFDILEKSTIEENRFPIGTHARIKYENFYSNLSKDNLANLENFNMKVIDSLRKKHKYIVSNIPQNITTDYYKYSGYVTVGGGENDFHSLLLVKQLRNLESELPIEVIIPPMFEKDEILCTEIFPTFNAHCVSMNDIFGVDNLEKLGYNLHLVETLAVLASSFENAMFISSSTLPLHNPDHIFGSAVYKKYQAIVWPSVYRKTVSPQYYNIAGIEIDESAPVRIINDRFTPLKYYKEFMEARIKRVSVADYNFHDFKGAMSDYSNVSNLYVINKIKNFDVLLLMLYYTNDGPFRYNSLLNLAYYKDSGDFLSASLHYFKKPFYQNMKTPGKIGHITNKHKTQVTSHYDPVEDYELMVGQVYKMEEKRKNEGASYNYDYYSEMREPYNSYTSTPLFFHVESAGLNPFKIEEAAIYSDETTQNKRIYGEHIRFYGMDFELEYTKLANEILCNSSIEFKSFRDENLQRICKEFFPSRLKYLSATSDTLWNKFLFEKKLPYPVPESERFDLESRIDASLRSDTDFKLEEVKRPLNVLL